MRQVDPQGDVARERHVEAGAQRQRATAGRGGLRAVLDARRDGAQPALDVGARAPARTPVVDAHQVDGRHGAARAGDRHVVIGAEDVELEREDSAESPAGVQHGAAAVACHRGQRALVERNGRRRQPEAGAKPRPGIGRGSGARRGDGARPSDGQGRGQGRRDERVGEPAPPGHAGGGGNPWNSRTNAGTRCHGVFSSGLCDTR